jgi:hypothetical protein
VGYKFVVGVRKLAELAEAGMRTAEKVGTIAEGILQLLAGIEGNHLAEDNIVAGIVRIPAAAAAPAVPAELVHGVQKAADLLGGTRRLLG